MTTASQKESVEEPQEPAGPFAKIGDMIEDVLDDIGDALNGKKKPEEPKHPKDDPKPDPCCGPPTVG